MVAMTPTPRCLLRTASLRPVRVSAEVDRLIAAWRRGDEQAATKLFNRFVGWVEGIVSHRLNSRYCGRIDVEDVRQMVFCDVFQRLRGESLSFQSDDRFRHWIGCVSRNRAIKQVNYERAARRTVNREVHATVRTPLVEIVDCQPARRQSTPDEALARREELSRAMSALDPACQTVAKMLAEGYSQLEIAGRLKITDRTVRRKMERIRLAFARVIDWA